MTRSQILAVAAALFLLGGLGDPAPAQEHWANKLFYEGTSHNFGMLEPGTLPRHRFAMKNIYKVPLDIFQVRASCGCVFWEFTKKTLQPGETAGFDVIMDTRRFSGAKSLVLYVTVGNGSEFQSTASLRVSAFVKEYLTDD